MALSPYVRVSVVDQHPAAQTDALTDAGCVEIFVEHASGVLARRPELDEALRFLRSGDTLVITKLDRLGRSVKNLKAVAVQLEEAGVALGSSPKVSIPAPRADGCSFTCWPRWPSSSMT